MDQSQRWLVQPLQYTEEMNKRDEGREDQTLAEESIATQLFYSFLESSIVGHARYVYDCLLELFPCLPEESLQVQPTAVVSALAGCLYRWHNSVADNIHPSQAEATEVSQQLVRLGLSMLFPDLIEVVPQTEEEAKPPLKGMLLRYSATLMLVTLHIQQENGEQVTLALDDDTLMSMLGDHECVSYTHGDESNHVMPDKITREIEDGHIIRTVVEKEGVEMER